MDENIAPASPPRHIPSGVVRKARLPEPRRRLPGGELVSQSVLTAAAELLEKVAFGVDDCEVDRLVETLREASKGGDDAAGFEKFHLQVSGIRQAMQDNALSERGLNVLIDTTHDLSSTLEPAGSLAHDRRPGAQSRRRRRRLGDRSGRESGDFPRGDRGRASVSRDRANDQPDRSRRGQPGDELQKLLRDAGLSG